VLQKLAPALNTFRPLGFSDMGTLPLWEQDDDGLKAGTPQLIVRGSHVTQLPSRPTGPTPAEKCRSMSTV